MLSDRPAYMRRELGLSNDRRHGISKRSTSRCNEMDFGAGDVKK